MMTFKLSILISFALLVVGGCATMPTGPSVNILPTPGKPFDIFRAEDATCRQWAQQQLGVSASADLRSKRCFRSSRGHGNWSWAGCRHRFSLRPRWSRCPHWWCIWTSLWNVSRCQIQAEFMAGQPNADMTMPMSSVCIPTGIRYPDTALM